MKMSRSKLPCQRRLILEGTNLFPGAGLVVLPEH